MRLSRTLNGFVCPSDLRLELTRELFKFFFNEKHSKMESRNSAFDFL